MNEDNERDRARRALSFGSVAETYDAYRPELPAEACAFWKIARGTVVADVAAGTGLASRTFEKAGAEVIAVEPDDEMRRVLSGRSPGIDARKGTAESMPLGDASVDVVTIVSAFHWVDAAAAFHEASRVLRDGGIFGIGWDGLDRSVGWVRALFEALGAGAGESPFRAPHGLHDPSAITLPSDAPFLEVRTTEIAWTWGRTLNELAALYGTYSNVITADAGAPSTDRRDARAQIVARTVDPALLDAEGRVAVPMIARCWRAVRAPRSSS